MSLALGRDEELFQLKKKGEKGGKGGKGRV